jgi:hypothetical protein
MHLNSKFLIKIFGLSTVITITAFCILLSNTVVLEVHQIIILAALLLASVLLWILIWLQPQDATIDTFKVFLFRNIFFCNDIFQINLLIDFDVF